MKIRDALTSDLAAIVEIYNQSIPDKEATADTTPITVADRLDWYDRHSEYRPLWIAEKQNKTMGWLSFQDFYGRPAYQHTAEISIYVATDCHRQGVGNRLVARAIAQSPQLKLTTLLAFVFAHNQASLKLFANHGFQQWGHLPNIAQLDDTERSLIILGRRIE